MRHSDDITLLDVIGVASVCVILIGTLFLCQCSDTQLVTEYVETVATLDSSEMGVCFLCSYDYGGHTLAATGYYCNELADLDTNTWVCVWAPFTDTLGPQP